MFYKFEIWLEPDGTTSCLMSGKGGKNARSELPEGSKLLHTFKSDSHVESINIYYTYLKEHLNDTSVTLPYTSRIPWDNKPYPKDLA